MGLFTFILDYCGGTYVSQAICRTPEDLVPALGNSINWNALANANSESEKRRFLEDLAEFPPSLIDGLKNVWCISARLGKHMAIIHIVDTTEHASMAGALPGS